MPRELRPQFVKFWTMSSNCPSVWYIYGAGGLGIETADILLELIDSDLISKHHVEFIVDSPAATETNGIPVTHLDKAISGSNVTIAVGEPALRKKLADKAHERGLVLSSIVSPHAYVSRSAFIGQGAVIAPLASVQSMATVGPNVSINTQAIIGHHVTIGRGAVVSSQVNLGGASAVGVGSYVGMGSLVLEKIKIGNWSIVGMGSVVYKDVPDEVIALGNPARVARKNDDRKVFK